MNSLKSNFAVQAANEQFSPEFVFAAEYGLRSTTSSLAVVRGGRTSDICTTRRHPTTQFLTGVVPRRRTDCAVSAARQPQHLAAPMFGGFVARHPGLYGGRDELQLSGLRARLYVRAEWNVETTSIFPKIFVSPICLQL